MVGTRSLLSNDTGLIVRIAIVVNKHTSTMASHDFATASIIAVATLGDQKTSLLITFLPETFDALARCRLKEEVV